MAEKDMRAFVISKLKTIDARAVENKCGIGTPDVNYADGWIELKWMKRWPKIRDSEPVLFPHFTAQQRLWARRRSERNGRVFLLAKIGQDWLLFTGAWAAEHFGKVGRDRLIADAIGHWHPHLDHKELIKCLRA